MKNLVRVLFAALLVVEIISWTTDALLPDPDFTWFGLVGTALGAWVFLEILNFPGWLWGLAWLSAALDAYSDAFHLYSRWAPSYPWDRVMHVWGGAVVASFALELILRAVRSGAFEARRPVLAVALAVLLTTVSMGYVYEAWEYLTDVVYTKKSLALGDGRDTVDDMNLNLLGALITLALARPYVARKLRKKE